MFDNDGVQAAIETVTMLATLTAGLTKPVMDMVKLAFPKLKQRPGLVPPLATVLGVLMQLLLALSADIAVTRTSLAQMVLAALLGAVGAAGLDRLQSKSGELSSSLPETENQPAGEGKRGSAPQMKGRAPVPVGD